MRNCPPFTNLTVSFQPPCASSSPLTSLHTLPQHSPGTTAPPSTPTSTFRCLQACKSLTPALHTPHPCYPNPPHPSAHYPDTHQAQQQLPLHPTAPLPQHSPGTTAPPSAPRNPFSQPLTNTRHLPQYSPGTAAAGLGPPAARHSGSAAPRSRRPAPPAGDRTAAAAQCVPPAASRQSALPAARYAQRAGHQSRPAVAVMRL